MYDPVIGRWSVVDPLADLAPDWTPYRYGFNNPLKYTDPTGMFEYMKGEYGENIEVGQTWSHSQDGGYLPDKKSKEEKKPASDAIVSVYTGDQNQSNGGGEDFSLAKMYLHFQIGGGDPMTINTSSVDLTGTTQSELGLADMKKGEIRAVNLFNAGILNQAALAFGRVNMKYHGKNEFSIVTDPSSRFDFSPLIDSSASTGRNAGNILGAAINYNIPLIPIHLLTPAVPLIFGGPFSINFNGTTSIPK